MRNDRGNKIRKKFFSKNNIEDRGQKVLVYFGADSQEYFQQAFPAFCSLLLQEKNILDNYIILIQQHPRVKYTNQDCAQPIFQLLRSKVYVSNLPSLEVLAFADALLY